MQVQRCLPRTAHPCAHPVCISAYSRLVCRAARKPSSTRNPATEQQVQTSRSTVPTPLSSVERYAGDADKERSRKFRRVTFDHAAWANHRSTSRYWRHISSMTRSRVVKALAVPMTYVGIVATMVCCYESLLKDHLLPDWGFEWPGLAVSTTGVYSLSTFALSLLLVFRTNSSYQRWNDARKLWGLTTNRCRDLSRQVLQWMTDPCDAELAAASCRLIRAFPIALMASLRIDHNLKSDLAVILQPQELELIMAQPHTCTAILQALGQLVAASRIKELQKLRIDENITVLQDTLGGCERIFRTPIPLVYTRHTSRFLLCWLTILPFCTAGQVGWLTVPIACAMAFFLLGIEEIGVQVEEPFGILALEQFCENISKNVLQAESAAAAMQGLALAHAYQDAAVAQVAAAAQRGSSSSSSSGGGLSLTSPPQVVVAGQQVAAADQAYRAPVSLPQSMAPAAAAGGVNGLAGNSSNNGGGNGVSGQQQQQQQQQQQRVVLDSWAAAAVTGQLSGGSAASMGSREYEPAGGTEGFEASEATGYWQSSVAGGAMAGDSEDYPF